jgi:histidine ammonia-lyase
MATFAARRLGPLAANLRGIIAVELLAAAQGLEFQRPLRSSGPVEELHALIRSRVAPLAADRLFAPDLNAAIGLIESGAFDRFVPLALDPVAE